MPNPPKLPKFHFPFLLLRLIWQGLKVLQWNARKHLSSTWFRFKSTKMCFFHENTLISEGRWLFLTFDCHFVIVVMQRLPWSLEFEPFFFFWVELPLPMMRTSFLACFHALLYKYLSVLNCVSIIVGNFCGLESLNLSSNSRCIYYTHLSVLYLVWKLAFLVDE